MTCAGSWRSNKDLLHEPTGLAEEYPTAQPVDYVFALSNMNALYAAFNVTVPGTPAVATTSLEQENSTAALHQNKEIKKWRGTSRPEFTPAQRRHLGTKTVPPYIIVAALLDHNISLYPHTIDPWMREGNVAHMIRDRTRVKRSAYPDASFGKRVGSTVGRKMCTKALVTSPLSGALKNADKNWKRDHGTAQYGKTY